MSTRQIMIIGGTGHVGTFMAPMFVEEGWDVVVVSGGRTLPPKDKPWDKIKYLPCAIGKDGWQKELTAEKPDVVVDMPGTADAVYKAFKDTAKQIIACGSVWMFGMPNTVPTPETTQAPCPFEGYAKRYEQLKQMIENSNQGNVPFTAIMPPNICVPGKIPLECLGGRDIDVHKSHAAGETVTIPDGPEPLIGPCDAEDIARCFFLAAMSPDKAAGHFFNVGSAYALTFSQLVQAFSDIYKTKIPTKTVPWQEYEDKVSPGIGHWWHFKAHMCPLIEKARNLIGYQPQFTPEQTLQRAVDWMRQQSLI